MAMDDERQVNQEEVLPAAEESKQKQDAAGEKARRVAPKGLSKLLLLLAVVLVVVVLTTMEDGNHFASLRRWLMYGDSGTGQNYYTYAADSGNRFALLGEDLLVVNQNAIQLLEDDGSIRYNLPVSVVEPMVSVGGGTAAVCDVGGSSLYLLDKTGVRRELTLSGGLRYYSARLNSAGWLAVTEEKNGYKASISVYNSSGELVFSFDSYDSYITDALVTEDCRYVAAVSLDPQESVFSSTLRIYDLSEALLAAGRSAHGHYLHGGYAPGPVRHPAGPGGSGGESKAGLRLRQPLPPRLRLGRWGLLRAAAGEVPSGQYLHAHHL